MPATEDKSPAEPAPVPQRPPADVDHDEEHSEDEPVEAPNGASEHKKKKKPKKKKKKAKPEPGKQTDPPTIGLSKLFPDGNYPEGEIQDYPNDNAWRTTNEEKRYLERMTMEIEEDTYNNIRKAAEVHRQVRAYAQRMIKPGISMTEIAENIENATRFLVEGDDFEAGIGFPTGLNVNHIAAHFSPNAGDKQILQQSDVLKVDFGVHVKGRIVDSAFTMIWEPTYEKLLQAVREATDTGVRVSGIDARLGEIGEAIQETMESYEVVVGTDTYRVKCIENLNGHSIHRYRIHGDKSVPIVKTNDQTKMEEGEYFAIETFGSTGRGRVHESGDCSHYAKIADAPHIPLRLTTAKSLLKTINANFGTLPFCRRYLDRLGETKYLMGLNHLVSNGIVQDYPPICDIRGSQTAQFEHTILLRPTRKEVVSRGDDY